MELLVVIGIMIILMAMATVGYTQVQRNSLDARRKADLEIIRQALELCKSESGEYPNLISGLLDANTCGGIVPLKEIPVDPKSGENYVYSSETTVTYTIEATLSDGVTVVTKTNP